MNRQGIQAPPLVTQNLYLFPDTNLFIQCRALGELEWSKWRGFHEIHLIVCLPVQQEIDKQKTLGKNNRVGRRARKTYSLFRSIATGERQYQLIREAAPQVKLFLESPSLPDPELSERLDYNSFDDRMVGCLHRYAKDHPNADVRLLTHDTGPLMTASGLGLSVAPIEDEWLLPPESTKTERELSRLNAEIVQLKKAEPAFNVRCVDDAGVDVESLDLVRGIYEALGEDEIANYITILQERFPIATEFNRQVPKPARATVAAMLGEQWHFERASEEAISNYGDREYPQWIQDCRDMLSNIHEALQRRERQISFRFEISNEGTRPGTDALVVFRAKGNFKICPPPSEEDDTEDSAKAEPSIPSPPRPPRGRWISSPTSLSRMLGHFDSFQTPRAIDMPALSIAPHLSEERRRDPNLFYYKLGRNTEPSDTFSLECEQWRHGTGVEGFYGDIFLPEAVTPVVGALECEIHAENLSKPIIATIPVRIETQYGTSKDFANGLVKPPWNEFFRS